MSSRAVAPLAIANCTTGAAPVGALAIVLPHDKAAPVARVLGVVASADRPRQLFINLAQARRWIDGLMAPA